MVDRAARFKAGTTRVVAQMVQFGVKGTSVPLKAAIEHVLLVSRRARQ